MCMTRVTVIALAFLLGGCATAKFYPVCVLDTGHAPPAALWAETRPRLEQVLRRVTHGWPPEWLDVEGALVVAPKYQQRSLDRIWPQYACTIANAAGPGRGILLDDCRRQVSLFLAGQPAFWPASPSQGAPACATTSDLAGP